jgi:hypothetical protein
MLDKATTYSPPATAIATTDIAGQTIALAWDTATDTARDEFVRKHLLAVWDSLERVTACDRAPTA